MSNESHYGGNPLLFSLVEIKVWGPPPRGEHAPHMEMDASWWDYVTTTYLNTGKLLEMSNTMSSNNIILSLFFKFNTPADREDFFGDSQVNMGLAARIDYARSNSFKLLQVDEDRSYPLKTTPITFPVSRNRINQETARLDYNPWEISGRLTIHATPSTAT
jgi:hypothetical protein